MAPFQIAWPNFAFSSIKDPEARRIYRDVTTLILLGCSFFTLGTYIFRFQIIDLLSPESYRGGAAIVPWISASMILLGLNPVVSLGPKIQKDTKPLAWISVVTTLVNILIIGDLYSKMGNIGAAIATFLSYLFLTVTIIYHQPQVLLFSSGLEEDWNYHHFSIFIGIDKYSCRG